MDDPIHIISLGAGVQSSTMALMAAHGEITPMPRCAIFADTQAEPQSVYKWLDWLEKQLPFPVRRITHGSLTEAITKLNKRKDGNGHWVYSGIPTFNVNPDGTHGHVQRQCTRLFKVEPLDRESRRLIPVEAMKKWRQEHREALRSIRDHEKQMRAAGTSARGRAEEWEECQKDALVEKWIGISLDEVHRMKSARHPWMIFRYPLVDLKLTRDSCLAWMKRNGYPVPPRSACTYCPYHSDEEWLRLKNEEPEDFAEAVRVDHLYRKLKIQADPSALRGVPFLHILRVPLDQIDFAERIRAKQQRIAERLAKKLPLKDEDQLELWGNECEGMCGV